MDQQHIDISAIKSAIEQPSAPSSDFDLNVGVPWPKAETLRPAAVLIPLLETSAGMQVVLTRRSAALRNHPGQIAFPGGKKDDGDKTLTDAALREAHEEIGLEPSNVEIVGEMLPHVTVSRFEVTPIVGHIRAEFEIRPEAGEVDEVFQVPLGHLTDPNRYIIQSRSWLGQERFFYTVPYGPYYIWGATARILRRLAERLA